MVALNLAMDWDYILVFFAINEDDASLHKLAVLVATVNLAYKIRKNDKSASSEATWELCIITFYFILIIR